MELRRAQCKEVKYYEKSWSNKDYIHYLICIFALLKKKKKKGALINFLSWIGDFLYLFRVQINIYSLFMYSELYVRIKNFRRPLDHMHLIRLNMNIIMHSNSYLQRLS